MRTFISEILFLLIETLFSLRSLFGCGCLGSSFFSLRSLLSRSLGLSSLTRTTSSLLLGLSLSHFGIEVYELDEADLSSVTLTGTQLDDLLESLNLSFGTDISKYKLDKE